MKYPAPQSVKTLFGESVTRPSSVQDSPLKLTRCPNCEGLFFVNKKSGVIINARCNKYSCPYCGRKRHMQLRFAIEKVLSNYNHIRLFTFTIRTNRNDDRQKHIKLFAEAWRRFITDIRRNKYLQRHQKNCQYLRVNEFTEKGFLHAHVFFLTFMPIRIIRAIWQHHVLKVFHKQGWNSNVQIKHSYNARKAGKYVAKYVSKGSLELNLKFSKYSKSSKIILFAKKSSSGEWLFINARRTDLILTHYAFPSQDTSSSEQISIENQVSESTPSNQLFIYTTKQDHPPDHLYYISE